MYRQKDYDAVINNIDAIKDEASIDFLRNYEPTTKEKYEVSQIILDYIKKNNKIMYGGYAQNLLLKSKDKKESIYHELDGVYFKLADREIADIEFYSDKPGQDLVELVELFHKKGYKYVSGQEADHAGTYKLSVNIQQYSDITYVPTYLLKNISYIEIDGIKCVEPHFMLIDALNMMIDPMTSFFRLPTPIKRWQKILSYYPFDKSLLNFNYYDFETNDEILKDIRKNLIHNSQLIVSGFYAYNYYVKKVDKKLAIKIPHYDIISSQFNKDAINIANYLKNKYSDKLSVKEFSPYLSFLGKRIHYYINDKLVLIIHDNNDKCTVYNTSEKKKSLFATFNLVIRHMLIVKYYMRSKTKEKTSDNIYDSLIVKLFYARDKYLETHKLTIVEPSVFKDLTIKCIGDTMDFKRKSFIKKNQRAKENKIIVHRYEAEGRNAKQRDYFMEKRYENCSGNEIFNEKKYLLKNFKHKK